MSDSMIQQDAAEALEETNAATTGTIGTEFIDAEVDTAANADAAAADDRTSATSPTAERTKVTARAMKSRLSQVSIPDLGKRGRIAARAAVALALAASIGSSIVFSQHDARDKELLTAREQAQTAACKYAPALASYDAKNLDAYFTAVLDGATGDWRKQFDSTSKDLRDVLTQGQVVSKATDVQCAIRNADRDSAEAIVVIGQTITSLGTQGKPAPGQLSMVMRLERSGDRWLVNKVNSPLAQQPQQ
ncbi:hypothetical protein [Nocardia aurantiaca]|uniref:hypothetical protein n=1 Tax=Nocardia aurantiaca TaxID=2675850 RepID=UPI001E3EFDFC|nr:hypothetical protein [Nocardia aurantiaca]